MEKLKNIELLNHRDDSVADKIYSICQQAYRSEATLIGVNDFPPLRRSARDIAFTDSRFWGLRAGDSLAGIIEIDQDPAMLQISSLAISPTLFRQGIGTYLLNNVLANLKWEKAEVQTALANAPAIGLYQKAGFTEQKRWASKEGIVLVLMSKHNAN